MNVHNQCIAEASIDIRNASQFNVNIKVVGFRVGINLDASYGYGYMQQIKPRSLAILCGATTRQRKQKYRMIEFGERVDGDLLVRLEKREISARFTMAQNQPKFPSHVFDFHDEAINISCVKWAIFVSNVRHAQINYHYSLCIFSCSHLQPLCSPIKWCLRRINSLLQFMALILIHSRPKCAFMAPDAEM